MNIREIEQYLVQVKSVKSCRILTDGEGAIEEIHIVSDLKRSPKQISRDIQSILVSAFGLDVDYKKISIAQIKQDSIENGDFRLKLKSVEYSTTENRSEIKVVLEKDEELFDGTTSGPNTSNNILRMLAKATLQAVEKFYEIEEHFILEDIKSVSIATKEAVVVAVTEINGTHEQILSGSAIADKDKKEAVVKATLNAINRMVTRLSN